MVFSSLTFILIFLPIVLGLYFLTQNRTLRNLILLVSSLIFYAWGEPIYIFLMLFSVLSSYSLTLLSEGLKGQSSSRARLVFALSITINLLVLGFFKYYGFLVANINLLTGWDWAIHDLPLPIGISFYTFQIMSYSIDVYMGRVAAQRNILTLCTYVALFPQLIAGPIIRYIDVERELTERRETLEGFVIGSQRFIIGLAKKVILANPMGLLADTIYSSPADGYSTLILWTAALAYSLQIYFDFSGYSDMAIGLGRIFGFKYKENFNYPYTATSITDFWRRWHMSMSSWFRDYLYFPLGGSRVGKYKVIRNLLLVWAATGLWHGAAWNFIAWGLFYFLVLIMEKNFLNRFIDRIPQIFLHLYTIFVIMIAWVLFRIEDSLQLQVVLYKMFVYQPAQLSSFLYEYSEVLYTLPFMLVAIICSGPFYRDFMAKHDQGYIQKMNYVFVFLLFIISIAVIVGESFNPFIYFRF